MKYSIQESEAFSVIGQEIELTNFQRKNVQTSIRFWQTFNRNLKKIYLSQFGNWVKYAFMGRRSGRLYYFCAIPKKATIPEDFIHREIRPHKYLVVEHMGSMSRIYDTYGKIYNQILPALNCMPVQEDFIHFEKYDYRFHWNKENSIIEIWVPIQGEVSRDEVTGGYWS